MGNTGLGGQFCSPGPRDNGSTDLQLLLERQRIAQTRIESKEIIARRPTSSFVGSYTVLFEFLEDSRRAGYISDDRRVELSAALEDIWHGSTVDSTNAHFKGGDEHVSHVLPAHDIPLRKDVSLYINQGIPTSPVMDSPKLEDEATVALLSEIDFNCRTRGDVQADIGVVLYGLVQPYNLVARFSLDVSILANWLQAIAGQYMGAQYHNWQHAVDVYQFLYVCLDNGGCAQFLSYQDILVLLVGSLAHDVAHPGVNNAFVVNTGNPVAITYNDKSPLENMHASVFFETLRRPGMNYMANASAKDYQSFREKVIDCILATDMGRHFELVDRFTARVSTMDDDPFDKMTKMDTEAASKEGARSSRDDRRMLLTGFMHMADLGHTCRPWDIHRILVKDLEEEFFSQGDQERELGVPVMPLMDRTKDSMAVGQGFFLDKLVTPMLEPCCLFLSDELSRCLQDNIAENNRRWADLVQRFGKKTAADLLPLEDVAEKISASSSGRNGGASRATSQEKSA